MRLTRPHLRFLILILILVSPLNSLSTQPVSASQSISIFPRIWSIQAIDTPNGAFYPDLELDSHGTPHIALGNDHLYYATWNDGNWDLQLVDGASGTGNFASLAFDSKDRPHIAYQESKEDSGTWKPSLRYAYWNGSTWVVQTISRGGEWLSIALDSFDRPGIVFTNAGDLKFAKWNGTKWVIQTIDNCPQPVYPSVSIDARDAPHVSYNCNHLKYASWSGTYWNLVTLDNSITEQGETSIALDSNDYPHIAYHSDGLRYISWNGMAWEPPEIIDSNTSTGAGASLVIDSANKPHIIYVNSDSHTLHEAVFDGGDWSVQTIPNAVNAYAPTPLALDSNRDSHVAYFTGKEILYVYEDNGIWITPQLVNQPSWVGRQAAMVVDSSNHPHISYLDYYQKQIRYSTWDGSQWVNHIVDDVGDWHLYSSIQVDGNDLPHIAYFANGILKYANWDGIQWQIQSLGVGGSYASLALEKATDYPRIAFCSSGLKYIRWNGASWDAAQSIDTDCGGGDFGGEVSLALDGNDTPHIAYSHSGTGEMLYATIDHTSQWVKHVIAENSTGRSLALDSQGIPHITYCGTDPSYPQFVIRYASWDGSAWVLETADSAGKCALVSLVIDGSDVSHISYPNTSTDAINYVTREGNIWSSQIVEPNVGWTGMNYVPIAVGSDEAPWIAYPNEYTGDLMVAKGQRGERISGNAGVSGATITYTEAATMSVKTNSNGDYSFIVHDNWSGTVTPAKNGCVFTPAQHSYTNITTDQPDQNFSVRCTLSYQSVADEDGWVVETNENSNKGAGTNAIDLTLELGDEAANKQMLAILSFDTSDIPDNATITKVTLKIKKAGVSFGTNPFNVLGNLVVDVKKGSFGTRALKPSDFQAAASKTGVLTFTNNPVNNWYTKLLASANFKYINKAGVTQFRLRFQLDDNNDNGADIIKFYSGNAGMNARPVLIVQFKTP